MSELEQVMSLMKEAGRKILDYYGNVERNIKWDGSAITLADIASNKILVKGLHDLFPKDGILSEESMDNWERLAKERVWIIDPLDGTEDFIAQTGDFSVIVGLAVQCKSELGILYVPTQDVFFVGQRNQGAYRIASSGKEKLRVSDKTSVQDMTLIISRFYKENALQYIPARNVLPSGGGGLRICKMAQGLADIHVSFTGKEWDYCGPDIILSEAGGKMTTLDNQPCVWNNQDPRNKLTRVSSNGKAHELILGYALKYEEARRQYGK
jgi:3'(2'), 5'-bisphosphate nucleotidase